MYTYSLSLSRRLITPSFSLVHHSVSVPGNHVNQPKPNQTKPTHIYPIHIYTNTIHACVFACYLHLASMHLIIYLSSSSPSYIFSNPNLISCIYTYHQKATTSTTCNSSFISRTTRSLDFDDHKREKYN